MDILKARNITKIFLGVVALDAVNITLRRGRGTLYLRRKRRGQEHADQMPHRCL